MAGNPATHFGRQMKKERLARGWSLREFAARTGINIGHYAVVPVMRRGRVSALAAAVTGLRLSALSRCLAALAFVPGTSRAEGDSHDEQRRQ
jgi:transcriptional regulator with XRE-family HTH domain